MEKKSLIKILVVAVLGLMVLLAVRQASISGTFDDQVFLGPAEQQSVIAPEGIQGTVRQPIEPGEGERISYEAVLRAFTGRTLQFDQDCRATPSIMTIPAQAQFLVDNRSDVRRTISFDNRVYKVNPFDFVIAALPKQGTVIVACDRQPNRAIIDVQ